MPINATRAKLWFSSKEEEQHYDDLMMANIETSQDKDLEQPGFTFINTKPRAERFFSFTDRAQRQLEEVARAEAFPTSRPNPSLAYFRELPLVMTGVGTFIGYLILRELPVRNFYARGFLMTLYASWLYDRHRFLGSHRGILSHVKINYDPEIFKVFEQFTNMRQVMTAGSVGKSGLPSAGERWRMMQPGFYRAENEDLGKIGYNLRGRKEADWDGTFNQPVVPLLHPQSRDMKGTIF